MKLRPFASVHPLLAVLLSVAGLWGCEDSPSTEGVSTLGSCVYTNTFSRELECKEYTGAGWDLASAEVDCARPLAGQDSTFFPALACDFEAILGVCDVQDSRFSRDFRLFLSGDDASLCTAGESACTGILMGTFEASSVCEGAAPAPPPSGGTVFIQPYQECVPPVEGEAAGMSDGGQVCTQVAISGCTEPGRRFDDYASCEVILTQRPYYAYPPAASTDPEDPRLSDAEYMNDMTWLTEQVSACACICCHSDSSSTEGASGWDIDQGPLWIDGVDDEALAMLGGFSDSRAFGAYTPENNNGFNRTEVGLPSTDPERLQAFVLAELERRGRDQAWAEGVSAFGGPLVAQLEHVPEACASSEGISDDGTITWAGADARYIYVMEAGSANPGVPPNLDLPEGTLWRLDVGSADAAVSSGIQYGVVPEGVTQRWPSEGAAPADLVEGQEYYLYVLFDIGVPLSRCTFTR